MAQNYIQPGETLTIPAPADVLSGGVVIAEKIIGVAMGDALTGEPADVATVGVWELPKVGANTFDVGVYVYWDATAGLASSTASGNTKLGVAVQSADASTASVRVRLNGSF